VTIKPHENYLDACLRLDTLNEAAAHVLHWIWTMQAETQVSDEQLYWNLFPREYDLASHFIKPETLFELNRAFRP